MKTTITTSSSKFITLLKNDSIYNPIISIINGHINEITPLTFQEITVLSNIIANNFSITFHDKKRLGVYYDEYCKYFLDKYNEICFDTLARLIAFRMIPIELVKLVFDGYIIDKIFFDDLKCNLFQYFGNPFFKMYGNKEKLIFNNYQFSIMALIKKYENNIQ